jgi:hypothetical protein
MIGAPFSQRLCAGEVQKPALVKTSLLGVIGAVWALGCGTTPIDAVVEDRLVPSGSAGSGSIATVACDEPLAGRFMLTGETGCLRRGDPTTVFGDPAYATELSADCTSALAQWDLTPALAGTFTLRNVETQLSLDVRTAADVPGTPIILYEPNTLDNQRFWLRERSSGAYELAPRHAPTLCAEARVTGVEIWPCEVDDGGQVFRFARVSCP